MTPVHALKRFVPIVGLVFAAGCGYNTIQTYDEQVNAAASQIKVQLQRRADLIPNLVETVKAYAKQERTVFTEVAEARAKLAGAVQSGNLEQMAEANRQLTAPLGRLLAIAENYPQLKSNENFRALQDQLEVGAWPLPQQLRRQHLREASDVGVVPVHRLHPTLPAGADGEAAGEGATPLLRAGPATRGSFRWT